MLVPQPPVEMLVDKTPELWITMVLGVIASLAVIYSLIHWKQSQRPVVFTLLIAGGLMMIFEPLVDTVGGCWFPVNSYEAFTLWGRPIPVWLCLAYFFYFGIGVGMIWMSMKKGMTSRQLWLTFVLAMLGDLIFETILLTYDPYVYYGNQPLRLHKFPLWWAVVNGLIPIVLAAVVYRLDHLFTGWRTLLIIPAALTTSIAVNGAVGWPAWTVINSELSWAVTQAGGVLSFVIGIAIMAIVIKLTATDVVAVSQRQSASLAAI